MKDKNMNTWFFYVLFLLIIFISIPIILSFNVNAQSTWYNENYLYKKIITIDNSKIYDNLNNYILFLNITDINLKNHSIGNGLDIIFVNESDESLLYFETDFYENTNGYLNAYIKIPYLNKTKTNKIYMYYGNDNTTNKENLIGTWLNYTTVYHFSENSGNCLDSANNYDGNVIGCDYKQENYIGYSYYFNGGNNDYVDISSLVNILSNRNNGSLELIQKSNGGGGIIFSQSDFSDSTDYIYPIGITATYNVITGDLGSGGNWGYRGNTIINDNRFHYININSNGTINTFFIDGYSESVTWQSGGNDGTWFNDCGVGQDKVSIGLLNRVSGSKIPFTGYITEIRISNESKNLSWVNTTNNNFKYAYNGGFYSLSEEYPIGGIEYLYIYNYNILFWGLLFGLIFGLLIGTSINYKRGKNEKS